MAHGPMVEKPARAPVPSFAHGDVPQRHLLRAQNDLATRRIQKCT